MPDPHTPGDLKQQKLTPPRSCSQNPNSGHHRAVFPPEAQGRGVPASLWGLHIAPTSASWSYRLLPCASVFPLLSFVRSPTLIHGDFFSRPLITDNKTLFPNPEVTGGYEVGGQASGLLCVLCSQEGTPAPPPPGPEEPSTLPATASSSGPPVLWNLRAPCPARLVPRGVSLGKARGEGTRGRAGRYQVDTRACSEHRLHAHHPRDCGPLPGMGTGNPGGVPVPGSPGANA